MWNKKKLHDKLSKEIEGSLSGLANSQEFSEIRLILESYHAHFEKMLEVQALILDILQKQTGIEGNFDEQKYYKSKGFEQADKSKIESKTIDID